MLNRFILALTTIILFSPALVQSQIAAGICSGPNRSICKWYGHAWFCGDTEHNLGDVVKPADDYARYKLVAWTKDESIRQIRESINPPNWPGFCAGEYGKGCWTGYKRLWCRETPRNENPPGDMISKGYDF